MNDTFKILHLSGRKRSGFDRFSHIVKDGERRAVCGKIPHEHCQWVDEGAEIVSCPRCAKKLEDP